MLFGMRLRSGAYGHNDEPEPTAVDLVVDPSGDLRWRVSPSLWMIKGAAALVFTVGIVTSVGQPVRLAVAMLGALIFAGLALRDLLVPVRLEANAEGVTVAVGLFGHRTIPWGAIERIRVDERRRIGTTSRLLEIDIGETLYLFGESDLGAPVGPAAAALRQLSLSSRAAGGSAE